MTLNKSVDQTTILYGDRVKLKDLLHVRLNECGWCDKVRLLCREVVREEAGNISVDAIVQNVTPQARQMVPDAVKKELLLKIKGLLASREGIDV